jgi:uncharacterized cupin superfamily protein
MTKPIVNIADVELVPRPTANEPKGASAELYGLRIGRIGARVGAEQLGYNITAVPPGKRAFPYHSHRVNEEMFFVLQGTGEVRLGNETFPLRAGDILACPAGGIETAHQIINTGTDELRYLAVSTLRSPEICDYPDSDKFGIYDERPSPWQQRDPKQKLFRFLGREAQSIDYWDGE